MAVTRKPKAADTAGRHEVDIDALINRGGSIARQVEAENEPSAKAVLVNLRIPGDVLTRIDRAVAARKVRTPRHTWLMEAVLEKLERGE
jgi:hypothetical protein